MRDFLKEEWKDHVRTTKVRKDTTDSTRREAEQILAVRNKLVSVTINLSTIW